MSTGTIREFGDLAGVIVPDNQSSDLEFRSNEIVEGAGNLSAGSKVTYDLSWRMGEWTPVNIRPA